MALEVDLSEAIVILRNDAVGALTALCQGGLSSTFLQQCAMRSCRLQRHVCCQTHYRDLHAPGRVTASSWTLDEGVDDHSRAGALEVSVAGPASSELVRSHARQLAAACGISADGL